MPLSKRIDIDNVLRVRYNGKGGNMKRIFSVLLCFVVVILLAVYGIGCTDKTGGEENTIDYSITNEYEVSVSDSKIGVVYEPVSVTPQYGLIFYVGTAIDYTYYEYLGQALAKQGYLVVLPKVKMGLAYLLYSDNEPTFEQYSDVEFFIGGHSQGGGAAVRRAKENLTKAKGVVLYAPLCYNDDSIKEEGVPTLLIEATSDGVLTPEMKADAKTRLPSNRTEYMVNGCHMSFSTMDDDSTLSFFNDGPATKEEKEAQRSKTIEYTLAFMKTVVLGG